jgi:hypothetical protein
MSKSTDFIINDSQEQINTYINEICTDPKFLCNNKDMCATNSVHYADKESVNKICQDMEKAKKCDTDFGECMVSTINTFDEDKNNITTSFVNIIIPINNAFDEAANQKFLRLPALSSTKKPKSNEICNICACMNRFSTSPGASASVSEKSYTSPGQNTCIYPDFIEHYYYPVSVQNLNTKLTDKPPVKLGNYNVLNENIIFAHSEQDLMITNLYDLLVKNGISSQITKDFILKVLYPDDDVRKKELELYIINKQREGKSDFKNGVFYKNITFFYGIAVVFILWIILLLI